MAKPRIFVSSTYYDLRHIRSSLEQFITNLGYESILSEKGNIAYTPDLPLDESCYREATSCDIFLLIVGGRYGSPSSSDKETLKKSFYDRYDSITKLEYKSVIERDIPTYILIEKSVFSEYETFKKNRTNSKVEYAHVDSVNIFHLIDEIINQPRNNPIHQFDRHQDIEDWLREQWAGLFRELISQRSDKAQLISLTKQVGELANINTTLKRYLEEVVSKVSEDDAASIIKDEESRLKESKIMKEFESCGVVQELTSFGRKKNKIEDIRRIYEEVNSLNEFAAKLEEIDPEMYNASRLIKVWQEPDSDGLIKNINEPRRVLNLPELEFDKPKRKTSSNKK